MKRSFFFLVVLLVGIRGSGQEIDSMVKRLMDTAHVTGLCLGIIRDGKIADVRAYGYKNKPLGQLNDTATCFYAASFAKAVFAYLVMKLTDEGVIDLDKPLYEYLPKPLPEYDDYKDLAGDDRWKLLTARDCLDHTTGFPNFRWFNPRGNKKLEFFFTPGTRYAYSGEGMLLLQLVVETVTGRPLDSLAMEKVFIPLGIWRMKRRSRRRSGRRRMRRGRWRRRSRIIRGSLRL
jgi:CubicO group peptidase (beta-lactamase class C family)